VPAIEEPRKQNYGSRRRSIVTNANANNGPVINTIEGNVTDIVFKLDRNGREFLTVSIQQDGLTYPTNVRSRDAEIITRMRNAQGHMEAGREVWLRCEVKESPRSEGGVFRDVTRILRASLDGTPQEPDTEDTSPAPARAQAARPPSVIVSDENQMRIMRQSTLGYAATVIAPVVKEFETPQSMVQATVAIGQMFLSYVLTGEVPSFEDAPEQPVEAPEPNVDPVVGAWDGEPPFTGDMEEPGPEVFEV
jgi:hypothetical protein